MPYPSVAPSSVALRGRKCEGFRRGRGSGSGRGRGGSGSGNAGPTGSLRILKLTRGVTLGYTSGLNVARLWSEPRQVQSLEMQYGIIRAQALTPRESTAFIEKMLGDR
ncbi:Scr1 family TA system antitoxin-like transcriptional regulator [Streptomyces zhihengii]